MCFYLFKLKKKPGDGKYQTIENTFFQTKGYQPS
jgi:hypothetical protein